MAKRSNRRARPESFAEIVHNVETDESIIRHPRMRQPPRDSPWFVDRWTDAEGVRWKVRRYVSAPYIIRLLEDPAVPTRECASFTGEIRTLEQSERTLVIGKLHDLINTDADDVDECDWPPPFMYLELRDENGRSQVLVSLLGD